MAVRDVINAIPQIQSKSYLELGLGTGETFLHINAATKTGVDINQTDFCTHWMTTEKFFNIYNTLHPEVKFDVIFIDADHSVEAVFADYNNCVKHLADHGILLIHDLVPPTLDHTERPRCDDGYKFLRYLFDYSELTTITGDFEFGLTCVWQPAIAHWIPAIRDYNYADLFDHLKKSKNPDGTKRYPYTQQEFILAICRMLSHYDNIQN